ncbi:MAG: MOSC domain-containing protein [Methylococcales bacterium]|nr:MOSC domain-containing protein [Methylococcales bacterium]MBT7409443.1 MOSC domain-containing protein [Methylococcales bacterium]
MSEILLAELWHYPVKSMKGNRYKKLTIESRGFQFDRHWMLIDEEGKFLTQRQHPRMTLLKTTLKHGELSLTAEGFSTCKVTTKEKRQALNVDIWQDHCQANSVDKQVDHWLTDFLQQKCRLVEMPDNEVRQVSTDYAQPKDQVGFADGFPFLLISQASLDELNNRLETPVTMERFRPNLVITGCKAFAEDNWKRIRIGKIEFRLPKPCSRCSIPGINPLTAAKDKELLKILATYRHRDNQVFFGQNALHDHLGELTQNMPITILEKHND